VHEAILDATEELILELPYRLVTIEGIASRAGVGKSTVYRWWRTKEDLVLEVVLDRWYDAGIPDDSGCARQDLIEFSLVNVRNMQRRAGELILQVALNSTELRCGSSYEKIQEVLGGRRGIGREILQRAVEQGLLPSDVDDDLLLDVLAGAVLFQALKYGEVSEAIVEPLVDLVLKGQVPTTSF
jgi:AcrR family transcriptional regulator